MTWFHRAQRSVEQAGARVQHELDDAVRPDDDPGDRPEALRTAVFERITEVNRAAGRLPVDAVVAARRVLDVVREVVETSTERPLDVRAVIAVRGILEDYLPTTIRRFVALDPALVDNPRPSGRTPAQSLLEQLDTLEASAVELLDALHAHDADALLTQGSFLRTKFTGSDLDL